MNRRDFLKISAKAATVASAAKAASLLGAGAPAAPKAAAETPADAPGKGWIPADPSNSPVGTARGIFPGRVVWMRDLAATPWKGDINASHWWDSATGVNQEVVDRMLSRSLQALTGVTSDAAAWQKLFAHFNSTHQRGDAGYRPGEMVALKINCNNAYAGYGDNDNQIDAAPQSVLAMLRQLVNQAGVPQKNIVVCEAIRVIPDHLYQPCHAEFPDVLWMDSKGDGKNGRQPVNWHKNAFACSVTEKNQVGTSIPGLIFQSAYIVNMSLLKGHPTCGFTLTAKNHYGSIDGRDHKYYINTWQHKMGIYNPFVDLIGARHLGGKTLLFMIDGLFGTRDANDPVIAQFAGWKNLFGGEWSASFFLSQDPVAIDSVGYDFLRSEFGGFLASSHGGGHEVNADNYLHEAALADHPPSGTVYQPDGVRLASLGVHEHWNNAAEKKYSRNLSRDGRGIELVAVHDQAPA
ncbi:MAG TPA: DUF362 domain-containing protein [Opitutaceae bacterium]|nr:DUF362 domain-containing protein [Opitutaceae bacterium]